MAIELSKEFDERMDMIIDREAEIIADKIVFIIKQRVGDRQQINSICA